MLKDSKFEEIDKYMEEVNKYKVKCKCGHKVILINTDKAICSWCGHYVYKDKKQEFKERLTQCMKKNQNQDMCHTKNMMI